MIIAGYEDEPFAHMIPATQLVKDIEESTSSRVGLFQSRPSNEDSPLDGRSKLPRNRREPVPADYFPPLGLSNYGNPRTTKTSAVVISEKQPQTPPNDGIEPVSHLSGLPNKGKQKEKEESRAQPTDTTEKDPPHESRPAIAMNANEMKGIRLGMVVAALCAAEFVVTLVSSLIPFLFLNCTLMAIMGFANKSKTIDGKHSPWSRTTHDGGLPFPPLHRLVC